MRTFLLALLLTTFSLPATAQLVGDVEYGLGSYYSDEYENSTTAYGESFSNRDMVAAHKLYPYNSTVRVKNTANGQTATVRIIDKGPFIRGRIIEVSQAAAARLGMIGQSSAQVEVTLLSTPDQPAVASTRPEPEERIVTTPPATPTPVQTRPAPAPAPAQTTPQPAAPQAAPQTAERTPSIRSATEEPARAAAPVTRPSPVPAQTSPTEPAPVPVAPTSATVARPTAVPATVVPVEAPARTVSDDTRDRIKRTEGARLVTKATSFSPGVYQIAVLSPPAGTFGVQVGSFSTLESAMDKVVQLQGQYFDNILIQKVPVGPVFTYKVVLGPFADQASASNYSSDLKSRYKMAGFTVRLPAE